MLGRARRQAKQAGLEQGSKRSTHMDHLVDCLSMDQPARIRAAGQRIPSSGGTLQAQVGRKAERCLGKKSPIVVLDAPPLRK